MQHFLIWVAGAGLIGQCLIYLAALIGVAVHYVGRARTRRQALSLTGFLRHLCPPELLASRWTYSDTLYYVADRALGIVIYPVVGAFTVLCAGLVLAGLRQSFGSGPEIAFDALTFALFLIVGLLARDFVSFYLHMLQHRVPLLWEFHKVHHAPERLVPVTGHRLHPLELCLNLAGDAPVVGLLAGAYTWLGDGGLEIMVVCSAGLQALIGLVTLSPLRHSHIDLRFGALERIVLSPAHHHLHHSVEPEHWDKNFAAIFPFWDRAWHTLLAPPASDTYRLGLPGGESPEYASISSSYTRPVRSAFSRARKEGWATVLKLGKLANVPASPTARDPGQKPTATVDADAGRTVH